MPDRQEVVLVDPDGRPLGAFDKRGAHEPPGRLHLAFSVFLFRPDGTMLIQQRADSKYHFPGIWANTCCSHPEPGEEIVASARRRVLEELGVDCELGEVGAFTYRAVDPVSGLVEHEYDHVLVGTIREMMLQPAAEEIRDWRFVDPETVAGAGPGEGFAPWFSEALVIAWRSRG
ncbi:MAG: isopentenyl-diphosphate Delta-isomerase [Acidimicrobiales bacterium]